MKKKTKKKNEVIEIHIYIHEDKPLNNPLYPPNGGAGGTGIFYPQCTCNRTGCVGPCPIHGNNYPITWC